MAVRLSQVRCVLAASYCALSLPSGEATALSSTYVKSLKKLTSTS